MNRMEIAVVGVAAIAGGVLLARRSSGQGGNTLATPPTGTPLQHRPLPAGWYDDAAQSNTVGGVERVQLVALGFACGNNADCAMSMQSFARTQGLPDPMHAGANEADATTFAYTLDDKYRERTGAAPASSGWLYSRICRRRA